MKKRSSILAALLLPLAAFSQLEGFSITTDLSIQHSPKKDQRFWAFGHTTQANFHITGKDAVYAWFANYSNGKFSNQLVAAAQSPATNPQVIGYTNNSRVRLKHFSIGYKKYLKGRFDSQRTWNLYGYAGFGLLIGRVENTHSQSIDTALYMVPVRSGKANFKRLTLDTGLGAEFHLGGDFYLYSELKTWIPTTDYPSKHLLVNDEAPLVLLWNNGVRLVF